MLVKRLQRRLCSGFSLWGMMSKAMGPHQMACFLVLSLACQASGFVCNPRLSTSAPAMMRSSVRPSICNVALGLVPPPPPKKSAAGLTPPPPPPKQSSAPSPARAPAPAPAPARQAGEWRDAVLGNRKRQEVSGSRPNETPMAVRVAKQKFSEDMKDAMKAREEEKKKKRGGAPPPPMLTMQEWAVSNFLLVATKHVEIGQSA